MTKPLTALEWRLFLLSTNEQLRQEMKPASTKSEGSDDDG